MSKWRLPTIEELTSLIDYSRFNPALPKGCPIKLRSSYYWSSTTVANHTGFAWVVDFSSGGVVFYDKANYLYVLCVRAGQSGSLDDLKETRFEDMGDGILDRKTGLVWQKAEDAPKEQMTWNEAMKYAEGLNDKTNAEALKERAVFGYRYKSIKDVKEDATSNIIDISDGGGIKPQETGVDKVRYEAHFGLGYTGFTVDGGKIDINAEGLNETHN